MEIHVIFAKLSWILFFIILIMRPLADITNWRWLQFNLKRRKELGIICGIAAFLHILIFLQTNNLIGNYLFNSAFWSFDNLYAWGNLAIILLFFPFITSNKYSQKLFKRHWKTIQNLSYPAFIFTGIHIYFAKDDWKLGLIPLFIWFSLWTWATIKNKKHS